MTEDTINRVKAVIDDDPSLSVRQVARATDISFQTVQRILRKHLKMFPYKIQIVQKLEPQDRPNRQFFAETLLEREATNPGYLKKIVFTDESTFSVHGEVNRHNCRIWATENPHVTFEKPRVSPKTQVWCAVHYSQIVGPYFFEEPTVTGANYLECLRTFAIPQIRQIPNVDEFQQDGAPPHWSLNVRDYLDATFPDAWIGRGGPTAWPARSPDITPLDFFFVGLHQGQSL